MNSGLFPVKSLWKRIPRQRVLSLEEQCWSVRLYTCSDFTRFSEIHSILTPSNLWRAASQRPDCVNLMKFLAQLLCKLILKQPCEF